MRSCQYQRWHLLRYKLHQMKKLKDILLEMQSIAFNVDKDIDKIDI